MKKFTLLLLFFISQWAFAQESSEPDGFSLKGEFRLNPLYSDGFRIPLHEGERSEAYVQQRTRLILDYTRKNDLKTRIILQDLRAWGDRGIRKEIPSISVFRAWAEKYFTPELSLKIGRQGLIYDDQYILGELNWGGTMAHDAALLKYERSTMKAHLGVAYNNSRFVLQKEPYTLPYHKNMQFIWLHKDIQKLSASFIMLNRGIEKPDNNFTTRYEQTVGTNMSYALSKSLALTGIFYHQMGQDTVGTGRKIDANLISARINWKVNQYLKLKAGGDILSGTDIRQASNPGYNEYNNFNILYGLRHGNFGYLDYFYVKMDPITGLEDYYIGTTFSPVKKFKLVSNLHNFYSHEEMPDREDFTQSMEKNLGFELDLKGSYKLSPDFSATLGYSKMWTTDTFDAYYESQETLGSQVIYAIITISPTFFKTEINH